MPGKDWKKWGRISHFQLLTKIRIPGSSHLPLKLIVSLWDKIWRQRALLWATHPFCRFARPLQLAVKTQSLTPCKERWYLPHFPVINPLTRTIETHTLCAVNDNIVKQIGIKNQSLDRLYLQIIPPLQIMSDSATTRSLSKRTRRSNDSFCASRNWWIIEVFLQHNSLTITIVSQKYRDLLQP